ncbi:hypothetical protein [Streptomyces sp. NPDC020817]|uniref:hypothetical protein n=1 Tax=Streptomyces sp. NPDC020817 TaxID=3365095 RepID=UPI003797DC32
MPDWIPPVLAGAFLVVSYRLVRTSGAGLRVAVLLMTLLNAGVLWLLAATGPAWAVVAVALVSLVAAVPGLAAAAQALAARIQRVDAEGLRDLIGQAADAVGPQVVGVCVVFSGALVLTGFADDARPEGRVKRRSEREPWTGRLRDRVYDRVPAPARRPPCSVHDPPLGRP